MADTALKILLEKLTISSSALLHDRLNGGNDYIGLNDDNLLSLIKRLTLNPLAIEVVGDEVKISEFSIPDDLDTSTHDDDGDTINLYNKRIGFNIIANPTRSSLIDDVLVNPDDTKSKLLELGFGPKTLMKKNLVDYQERRKTAFRPKWNLSLAARLRIKRSNRWTPETIRNDGQGRTNVPAVLIV